ncbi:MAG TPA: S9 family peptidase [Flavisolibacter sp.]|jgi:dipeptidyl aminopeptidase/acylaminoacyl peptidase|nr:S9 family peptidase [Flavisolibacter sp.]
MKKILLCLMGGLSLAASAQNKRHLQPSDVYRMQSIGGPQLSPDGQWVAYSVSTVDSVKDKRSTDLYMISWDGKETIQLTSNPAGESSPKWSPDGRYLSFISSRKSGEDKEEEGSQLWLMDRRGGEAKKLTNIKAELEDYDWSPDGKKLLLTIKDKDLSDSAKSKVRTPYVINRYQFKQDYQGYLDRRNSHLYLFDITTKKLDTLTKGMYNETGASWSPDGSQIAFVSNRTEDPDKNDNTDIYIMEAKPNASFKKLTSWAGSDGDPQWSPDGKWIAYLQSSSDQNFTMYGQPILSVISKDGGTPKLLSKAADRPVRSPRWSKDGSSLYVIMDDDRQTKLVSFNAATGAMNKVLEGNRAINVLENNLKTNSWIALVSEPQLPTELYAVEDGALRRLTHVQDSFVANLQLATPQGFQSKSKDGALVSGILYLPPGKPAKKLPLILFIHGGPVAQDNFGFDMDRQMYAAAGYAVAAVNYRGSNGRGLEYTKAIYGDWGHKEVLDVTGAADYLVKEGIADETKMGIAGWSYGGITTNYTIASDPRFKAAVSGAGSSLQLSMYGVDQYVSQYETELGAPWKNADKWIAISYPFFHADRIKTPTLFMASQNDFNVPVAGAEQMYQALRSLGIPTELVIYPGQNHGISVPSYIKDRYQRHITWFNQYLKPTF